MAWANPVTEIAERRAGERHSDPGWRNAPAMDDRWASGSFLRESLTELKPTPAPSGIDIDLVEVVLDELGASGRFHELAYLCAKLTDKQAGALRERFQQLANRWRKETAGLSLLGDRLMHPAYLQIVGLGPEVVPLLLEDLAKKPTHWGLALSAITGENPVQEDEAGNLQKIASAWIRWGRDKGIQFGGTGTP